MQRISRNLKRSDRSVGFVPTMGALHAAHLSLIKRARRENDFAIVSIFINPTQFGPREDFRQYPRNLKVDALLCKKEGVDIIFYPPAGEIYPEGYKTYVLVERLSEVLCGRFRPGHFQGVATIVAKLFNIIQPDIAYFGQKDMQQAIIIRRMARDLNMPVKIRIMPIIREADGLALSSRNRYLTPRERREAAVLFEALREARAMVKQGVVDSARIIRALRRIIQRKKTANPVRSKSPKATAAPSVRTSNGVKIQYIEIVDLNELRPVRRIKGKVLIALAVWIGKTRLIDNIIIS